MSETLQAPFPWPGGKSRAAHLIWERFGDVDNYVEPFAGSLAVLLGRPHTAKVETVNDVDGLLCNFWRALVHDPEQLAVYAAWPVNENDLTARHAYLVAQRDSLTRRLEGDPEFFDVKIAGWWVWGISCWIGSGWCAGKGPWRVIDGEMMDTRQLPHLSGAKGVNRQLPHLAGDKGVNPETAAPRDGIGRKIPNVGNRGKGIHGPEIADIKRQIPVLKRGNGVHALTLGHDQDAGILAWFEALSHRLRKVRVCCGDWSRVLGPSPTYLMGTTGICLDPPYAGYEDLYNGSKDVSVAVREWAIANGDNPLLRIALCGYDDEHAMPDGWVMVRWTAAGGYSNQNKDRDNQNRHRESIWFSRHCLNPAESLPLFAGLTP